MKTLWISSGEQLATMWVIAQGVSNHPHDNVKIEAHLGQNAMSENHESKEPEMLNRRKVLSALGAGTVGIAGLGVGSASAKTEESQKVDLGFEYISREKAQRIVESNAMGVLETLRNQGIIDQTHLFELEFKPLEPNEVVSSNGFVVLNPPSPNKEGRMSILSVKKDIDKGELNLFVNRDSEEAHAVLYTNDKTIIYHENNRVEDLSKTNELSPNRVAPPDCNENPSCGISECSRTVLNPFDSLEVVFDYSPEKKECVAARYRCC